MSVTTEGSDPMPRSAWYLSLGSLPQGGMLLSRSAMNKVWHASSCAGQKMALGSTPLTQEAPPGASVTCYCPTIYGERSFKEFGYLYWLPDGCSSDKEKRAREKAKYTNTVVVRANADEKERLEAERQAEEAWEKSGRTASWGCRWFEVWKEKVHEAVARGRFSK